MQTTKMYSKFKPLKSKAPISTYILLTNQLYFLPKEKGDKFTKHTTIQLTHILQKYARDYKLHV